MTSTPRLGLLMLSGLFGAAQLATAAEITKSNYLRYVPIEHPKAVRQTEASATLALFGDTADPAYRDEQPRDGIDDARGRRLHELALGFAPYLVRNTGAVPIDHRVFLQASRRFPLHLDTWDVSGEVPRPTNEETIDFAALGVPCPVPPPSVAPTAEPDDTREDCRLAALIEKNRPDRTPAASADGAVAAEREPFTVMYFDFPGHDPATWNREYGGGREGRPPSHYDGRQMAYVHPFIHRVTPSAQRTGGYELVLQYWFFYPFNDGGSNHEGDWEHVSVTISPRSRVERALSETEVHQILGGERGFDGPDPLVIKRIEYYFHRMVMVFDLSNPNVYLPRKEWALRVKQRLAQRHGQRAGGRKLLKLIRGRAYRNKRETSINTHPIGFIGGDSKGFDQLFVSPGRHGRNRDAHGTYPFPGLFKKVGPAGSSEAISVAFDHRRYLGSEARPLPPEVERFDLPDRLTLVPDWERLIDLVAEEPAVRHEWSWLVLPLRWGFPASSSPMAGVVANADTGNLSVVGPAYNKGWNRVAPNAGFALYDPHRLPWLFPLDVQDNFSNKLGYLNAPLGTLITVPPLDLVWRVGLLPLRATLGKRQPILFPEQEVPSRNLSFEVGLSWYWSPTIRLGFQLGRRFTSEHTVVAASLHERLGEETLPDGSTRYSNLGNSWEYAGSLRYTFREQTFQPFAKLGYGWTGYGIYTYATSDPRSTFRRKPASLLPNTFHAGVGVEFSFLRRAPWWGRQFGLRAGITATRYNLGTEGAITRTRLELLATKGF